MPRTKRTVLLASPPSTGRRLVVPELPLPPSLNNAYKNVRGRGRVLTKAATHYKETTALTISNAAALQGITVPPRCWLAVELAFVFDANNADGDNRCKLLLDAAAEALGFDDRYIQRMAWRKFIQPGHPRCELVIEVL